MEPAQSRLVVALDFSNRQAAWPVVELLRGIVGMFKVGKQLFTAEGPVLVREVVGAGEKVFLDLKFHDIPSTVAGAVAAAASLGVSLVNVHASGGVPMMEAAAQAAGGTATRVLAVTVLTSLDAAQLQAVGFAEPPNCLVLRLARLALTCGLAGVVAPPTEVALLRKELGPDFIILTPGIRPPGADRQDQARVATPAQAIRDGADYIVVGRPITKAADPIAAVRSILQQMIE
ncbi:MAG: orotidine-5'-phosphate decarboxylase [Acidobacteria bacterium]|nr:orotidine-5'-phosphate decarboxylase [Acidobacteriota bacterium]